jgi:hypothetical protein
VLKLSLTVCCSTWGEVSAASAGETQARTSVSAPTSEKTVFLRTILTTSLMPMKLMCQHCVRRGGRSLPGRYGRREWCSVRRRLGWVLR